MSDILYAVFPWVKSIHVIAVISWMAGMLYLPRLFVHHTENFLSKGESSPLFEMMELKLLKVIINPAMIVTWICGLIMVFTPGVIDWSAGWPWIKAISVILMSGFHGWLSARRKEIAAGNNRFTGRQYRFANEVPTVLMIVIVICVIARPF